MHLKSLKVFCDVVGRRSFSRAAEENGISQSGASQVVNQLERHLGTKLIDRSKRPFSLTPEGEIYYSGCRKIVERYFALEDRVRTLHDEVAGRVRVASIYSVGLHHMDRYLHQFLSQYPKANVRLEYLHPHKVYEAVENDQADLGLVSYPKPSRTVKAIGWRQEPMVLVCAPSHRLAKRPQVSLEEVAGEPIIGFDVDLTIRREIDRVLLEHRADVNVVMEFDNIETIKRAVEIGAGVSLLPAPTVVREVETGTLAAVPLSTNELVRPLGIIHRRGKDLGVTVRKFIELLRGEGHLFGAHPQSTLRNGEGDAEFTAAGNGSAMHGTAGSNQHDHLTAGGATLAAHSAAAN
ncbi:MAG TPA: LysR family transcriptional regulator [Pirellulales bacterium]|jgi:DNA-binding transcriptional LysR family regulator|nr:LysR family transcriptional regulator [Pirellulales bacterium]